jgi:SAM-dependent methyltransferase
MILGWLAVAGVVVLLGLAGGIMLHLVVANVNSMGSPLSVPTPMAVLPEVLAALEVPAGGVLVEPGCGDGRVLAAVLRRDGSVRVTGIERDPVMLAVGGTESAAEAGRHANGVVDRGRSGVHILEPAVHGAAGAEV